LDVLQVADATENQATTSIIDNANGKKPATKQYLESLYGKNVTTTNPYAATYTADFIVVLGADHATTQ
jgi:hypothetical protein